MPWADEAKNKAARADWQRRNKGKVRAAKLRHRAKVKKLRAATRVVKQGTCTTWKTATPAQRKYFKKLRWAGVRADQARKEAWGQEPWELRGVSSFRVLVRRIYKKSACQMLPNGKFQVTVPELGLTAKGKDAYTAWRAAWRAARHAQESASSEKTGAVSAAAALQAK